MNRENEIAVKTERLARMLAENELGGVLLNSQPNFAWATAGGSNGIDQSRENGAATLFVRNDGRRYMLASRIEMPRILAEEVSPEIFEPVEFAWEDEKSAPDFVLNLAKSLLKTPGQIGADLAFGADARIVEPQIARCRFELTEPEIERYRKLGKDAGETLGNLMKTIAPGESEKEIARRAKGELAARGIDAVVTLVAADDRLERFRHPVPTEKRWEKHIMVVVCARREGLIASLSRIACRGSVSGELQRKTEAVSRVSAKLLAATRPGATGAELYQIAAEAYAAENFPNEINLHHQGGAAGYRTRDWVAHPTNRETVRTNQAFAWNPSISGTKVEETVIVSGDEIETITASPDFPQIGVEIDGREYFSPDILPV